VIELTNAEARELSALLVRVGRPHSREEAVAMEGWVLRLNRGRTPDVHGVDLMAVYPLA
jgi:hypothetical protein